MNQQDYMERMQDSRYKELQITNCNSGKDYVFISYRSNSWKKILTDIVYKLQTKYHLRIYFDKDFASETNVWVDQFIRNMDSPRCKAILCFFDEGYVTSYATLLELMHAMNPRSKLSDSIYSINFPIDWEKLSNLDQNTGLGIKSQDNSAWEKEVEVFKDEFNRLAKKYDEIGAYYNPKYNSSELRMCDCKDIMSILQPKNKRDYVDTEEFYSQFIIEPLKKAVPSVFEHDEPIPDVAEKSTTAEREDKHAPSPKPIDWKQFDSIRAFSINGDKYNVNDAGQAYIAIVDVLKQKGVEINAPEIVPGETQEYVLLRDGSELDMIARGYGDWLRKVPAIKNSGIVLYDTALEGAVECETYEIIQRETEKPGPSAGVHGEETMRETIPEFIKSFNQLCKDFGTGGEAQKRLRNVKVILPEGCCDKPVIECEGYLKNIPKQMIEMMHDSTNGRYTEYIHNNLTGRLPDYKALLLVKDLRELDEEGRSGGESKSLWKPMRNAEYFVYQAYGLKDAVKAIQYVYDLYIDYLKENGSDEYKNRTVYIEYGLGEGTDIAAQDEFLQWLGSQPNKTKNTINNYKVALNKVLNQYEKITFDELLQRIDEIAPLYVKGAPKEALGNNMSGSVKAVLAQVKQYRSEAQKCHTQC